MTSSVKDVLRYLVLVYIVTVSHAHMRGLRGGLRLGCRCRATKLGEVCREVRTHKGPTQVSVEGVERQEISTTGDGDRLSQEGEGEQGPVSENPRAELSTGGMGSPVNRVKESPCPQR